MCGTREVLLELGTRASLSGVMEGIASEYDEGSGCNASESSYMARQVLDINISTNVIRKIVAEELTPGVSNR